MHRHLVLFLLVTTLGLAACSGDDADSTTTTATAVEAMPGDTAPAGVATDLFAVRYCEMLVVTVGDTTTAEVWGTQQLNDCPQEQFDSIDAAGVATELGATIAIPNGPRYWVLDGIVANELAGSGELHTFGGIEMRSIALVDLGSGVSDRKPFTEVAVERDTEFVFDAGREVHELTAADGSVYVMQSYSIEIDPGLTVEDLADLGNRLALPEGWTFSSRVLAESLVVEDLDGVATVIQDELRNSYQLRSRG